MPVSISLIGDDFTNLCLVCIWTQRRLALVYHSNKVLWVHDRLERLGLDEPASFCECEGETLARATVPTVDNMGAIVLDVVIEKNMVARRVGRSINKQ